MKLKVYFNLCRNTKHIRKIIERSNQTTLQNQKYRIFLNKIINQII